MAIMRLLAYTIFLILICSTQSFAQKKRDFNATVYLRDGTEIQGILKAEKYKEDWVVANNYQEFKITVGDDKLRVEKSKIRRIQLDGNRIFEVAYGNTTAQPNAAINNDFHIGQYLTNGDFEVFKICISRESGTIYGVGNISKPGPRVTAQYFWIKNGKFRQIKKPDFMESLRKIAITNTELAAFLDENDKEIRKDEQFEKILKFYAELEL